MKPLYTIDSTLSKEQYEDYIQALQQKMFIYNWFTYMLSAVVMGIVLLVTCQEEGGLNSKWMLVVALLFLVGLAQYMREKKAMNMWKDNPSMHNLVTTYEVYEHCIRQINTIGSWDLPYTEIKKVLETKQSYILLYQSSQGFIFPKEACTQQMMNYIMEKRRDKK